MLDIKKVGIKIYSFRKKIGYSQEKLAEILHISPQAVSKWENGHTLPDTSLLPVLAQIFGCTIDDIIMPAYTFDEKIEIEKPDALERQAEHIAEIIIKKMGDNSMSKNIGLEDQEIIDAVKKIHPDLNDFDITKNVIDKNSQFTALQIIVKTPQSELNLIEKIFEQEDNADLRNYKLFSQNKAIPTIYSLDIEKRIVLKEDLSKEYISGFHYDEDNKFGAIIRENFQKILHTAAQWHISFWENHKVFEQIGLDWRFETKENLMAHVSMMEKDFRKYKKNEESGKIPKVWEGEFDNGAYRTHFRFENHITHQQIAYFTDAIERLKNEYWKLVDARFHTGKNITVIHGDMYPGRANVSKNADTIVKFDGLQAVRIGLPTEDLAMLIALHIEPDKQKSQTLLDEYYRCLCINIKDYPYEMFLNDYKISIMENMFFTIRHINRGVFDYKMRDKAIKAFETFVLGIE